MVPNRATHHIYQGRTENNTVAGQITPAATEQDEDQQSCAGSWKTK